MPRLFEICQEQLRPLTVTDRDGQSVLRLQRGATVTDEFVEELNQLIGDDYYPRPTGAEISDLPTTVDLVESGL